MKSQLGYVGLGKMGSNMVERLRETGHEVITYARSGTGDVKNLADMVVRLKKPRTVWIMVSHQGVDEVLDQLTGILTKGDLIIDGGNSLYKETLHRARDLEAKGFEFMDIGVSGGPGGAREGACMMAGGKKEIYDRLEKEGFFKDTCVPGGWGYMGPHGAGHYVKMVHNGIEYGMMQSIAEGFDLLRHTKEFNLDLENIVDVYSHGSVITSRLVSWLGDALHKYGQDLNQISGKASASGEGQWTFEAGKRERVAMPAIKAAIDSRLKSQQEPSYQGKITSAMRGEFGHHPVTRGDDEPEVL